jgi:hypothetical protein
MLTTSRLSVSLPMPIHGSIRVKSVFTIATFVVAAGLAPAVASAGAQVVVDVYDGRTPLDRFTEVLSDPIEATTRSPGSGQSAFALANQSTGTLRVSGNSRYSDSFETFSIATAAFSDYVTFSGGFGQTAYLDYSFEGSLGVGGSPGHAVAVGQFDALVQAFTNGGSLPAVQSFESLGGSARECERQPNCEVGTSTARTGSLAFTIVDGTLFIGASLRGTATYGNSFDFSNKAKLYLRTPEGVSFSSASGFLSAAVPIGSGPVTAIPEPGTYALALAGLGMVVFVARRRTQQS